MFKRSPSVDIYYNTFKDVFMSIIFEPSLHQHHSVSNIDTYFVSLMGDTSRPSYDGSLPIDINTLSRKLT